MPDIPDWITPFADAAILVPLVMLYVRIVGLRAFAKMSAHDFAVTVAIGSTLAATVLNPDTPWWRGALALAALLAVQWAVGLVRTLAPGVQRWTDNEPLILMARGEERPEAMRRARVTSDDLRQKLRLAGVTEADTVSTVILETTGDVSVLQDMPARHLAREVRGTDRMERL